MGFLFLFVFFQGIGSHKRKRALDNVETEYRRTTRSSVRNEGFMLVPMSDKPEPRKRARSVKPKDAEGVTPMTPIKTLQMAGKMLEIPEEALTLEKLTVAPAKAQHTAVSNDE